MNNQHGIKEFGKPAHFHPLKAGILPTSDSLCHRRRGFLKKVLPCQWVIQPNVCEMQKLVTLLEWVSAVGRIKAREVNEDSVLPTCTSSWLGSQGSWLGSQGSRSFQGRKKHGYQEANKQIDSQAVRQ